MKAKLQLGSTELQLIPVWLALKNNETKQTIRVYFYELFKNTDQWKMILIYVITYSWLLFAYFYLGKKEVKKEDAKLDSIIAELKNLENQFQ